MNVPGGTSPGLTDDVDDEVALKKARALVHARGRESGAGHPPPSDLSGETHWLTRSVTLWLPSHIPWSTRHSDKLSCEQILLFVFEGR